MRIGGELGGPRENKRARLKAAIEPLGSIGFAKAPTVLEATIRELDEAYLWHSVSGGGANSYVYTLLSVYGKTPDEMDAIRAKWQPWLEQVLGVTSPNHAGQ